MRSMPRTAPLIISAVFLVLVLATGKGYPGRPELPLIGGKPALAVVNGEPLTLEEFERTLASLHGEMADNVSTSKPNPAQLLERLINAKLVVQEARTIGIDELPEVKAAVRTYEEETLRGMLYGYQVRNIKAPDRKDAEKRYREAVKEMKIKSVVFEKEDDGKRMEAEVRDGGDFDRSARKMVDAGESKGSLEGKYVKFESLDPAVGRTLASMKSGEVSPLLPVGKVYTLVKLEGIRYPEDPEARRKAEREALQAKKVAALKSYTDGLRKKYVKIDQKLVDGLDYESAEPGFEKLKADERAVATVKGEKPVTVADLTKALEKKFFHGPERAAQEKKINRRKDQTLEEILNKRVTIKEAKRQKLDRTAYFKTNVTEYRNGILFGVFVQKVIDPEIKAGEEELAAYYKDHANDYASPEMVRIDGLVFAKREDGEEAIEKLRKGADFLWLRENAEGQVDASKAADLMEFGGRMLVRSELPEGVRKAISGAAAGDYRSYADPGKVYYVLSIREVVPSSPMPFESVREDIGMKVSKEKRQAALREWERKLRGASEVKIFATGEKLDRIVAPGPR